MHRSATPGDRAWLKFAGCAVRWLSEKGPDGGRAGVYIDNALQGTVDLYAQTAQPMAEVFAKEGLNCGPHSIAIEVLEPGGAGSQNAQVTLDAFDVLPAD